MQKQQKYSPTWMTGALVGALLFGALLGTASAQVSCTFVDVDGDGLPDTLETSGIPLLDGTKVFTSPTQKDVFIAIVPATSGSLLPAPIPDPVTGFNPFDPTLWAPLGIVPHQLQPNQIASDRSFTTASTCAKAVRVTESLDTNGTVLGFCNQGTPNGLDGCVVYTQRIINFINSTCTTAGDTTTDRLAVFRKYVTHTILHEAGHTLGGLTSTYNASYGGYHYKTGGGYAMDQSVSYTAKGGKCTFNISNTWNATLDPPTVLLNK
jgi:hypothetical protein